MAGILGLPPGLRGYVAAEQMAQQRGVGQLNQMQGILGLQNAIRQQELDEQTNPLKLQLLQAQVAAAQNSRDWKPEKRFNPDTGREEYVLVNLKNPSQVLPFGGQKAPNLSFQNIGGATVGLDQATGQPRTEAIPHVPTPHQSWQQGVQFPWQQGVDTARLGQGAAGLQMTGQRNWWETGQAPPPIPGAPSPSVRPLPAPRAFPRVTPEEQAVRDADAARIRAGEASGGAGLLPSSVVLPPKAAAEVRAANLKNLGELQNKRDFNMKGIGEIITQAETILSSGKPTSSMMGTVQDATGGLFGLAVPGSTEAEQLRAIGGALVARMPRMEGPQSDRDVAMYREMAGQIGDSTIPIARRLAALDSVKQLWAKYDTNSPAPGPASIPGGGRWGIRRLP